MARQNFVSQGEGRRHTGRMPTDANAGWRNFDRQQFLLSRLVEHQVTDEKTIRLLLCGNKKSPKEKNLP